MVKAPGTTDRRRWGWRAALPASDAGSERPWRADATLRTMHRTGVVVLGLQLIALLVWSAVLYDRFALSTDFAGAEQAWYLMAHGHLNPVVGAWSDTHFLRNHDEFILWLLAPLYWVWHSGEMLLWVQDAAAVATSYVAFVWILNVVAGSSPTPGPPRRGLTPRALATIGLVLLVVNPWVVWAVSFDFHIQTLATCFALLTAFDLAHGRRRAWLWVALCLACGDVAATFVFGVGLSAVLAGRSTRRAGTVLLATALAVVTTVTLIGANIGSGLVDYVPSSVVGPEAARLAARSGGATIGTVLRTMVTRPGAYLSILWGNALNLYANIAPTGLIGFGAAWAIGVPCVVLLSNDLQPGARTSLDAFQNFPIYSFLTVGTLIVLTRLAVRRPRLARLLGVLLVANAVVWAAVWLPKVKSEWLRVSPAAAAALSTVSPQVGADDEVITSQGITGPLAQRTSYFTLPTPEIPVQARRLWFVVAPQQGIEVDSAYRAITQLAYLVDTAHGHLVHQIAGITTIEVVPPAGLRTIRLPTTCGVLPAWASSTAVGHPETSGPPSNWTMASSGRAGYVVDGGYLRLGAGRYVGRVVLRAEGPVSLEVWDSDRSLLLARRQIVSTDGFSSVDVPFQAPPQAARPATAGAGIWRTDPQPPPPNDEVELRIYTAGSTVAVRSTEILEADQRGTAVATPAGHC